LRVLKVFSQVRAFDETQSVFAPRSYGPSLLSFANQVSAVLTLAAQASTECEAFCHALSLEAYRVPNEEREALEQFRLSEPKPEDAIEDADTKSGCKWFAAHSVLSHAAGYIFGRFDIRFATGEKQPCDVLAPFAPLPCSSPGMLGDTDGKPFMATPSGYPLRIDWDGIVVDDPGQGCDIVRRVRDVLGIIWRDRAEAIEKEACEIHGVKDLRDYFRKPGKGGFWDDHISRYSKSRRSAPIYWLLQSSKKNYALWLYYHRLDNDLLFKALVNYVEPKIRLESSGLEALRNQKAAVGDRGKEAKRLATELEQQEDFISELRDFEDKLRRVANLHLEPDLNDGVVLNIAPLHELVPWKEAGEYWEELLKGKYEWSSIGKQLRQKGLVK